MRVEEFNAWVKMKNVRNTRRSLYIGPMVYIVPVRPERSVNASVKGARNPERKLKNDDEGVSEDKDVERVDKN